MPAPISVTMTPWSISSTMVLQEVKATSGIIVDVRSLEEYNGTDETTIRKGHFPNAINFEFSQVMDDKSMMKFPAELAKLFKAKGITPDKEIILYCKTIMRAGIVFFILSDMLNYKNVKVYDEAFFRLAI